MDTAHLSSAEIRSQFRDGQDSGFGNPLPEAPIGPQSNVSRNIAPVPRITIGAFCETHNVANTIEAASRDRLMSRAAVEVFAGGLDAALKYYQQNPVPNLLILEVGRDNDAFLHQLDALAELCEETTRVILIGYTNDIRFYRDLMSKGISEYVVAPLETTKLIGSISGIYRDNAAKKLGQVFTFIGAKGGVGSSTIAHNVAGLIGRQSKSNILLADLDLAFGTASLNLNIDASQGILDIVQGAARLDDVLLERLMVKYDDYLSLLTSPAAVGTPWDLSENTFEGLIEVAQSNLPYTVLDLPHIWTTWTRRVLVSSDQIVITLTPDLASVRNTKNLLQILKQLRPQDPVPKLVLNQVGVQKRPEIKAAELAKLLEVEPSAVISFDGALFGSAANNGKLITDATKDSPIRKSFASIASELVGKSKLIKDKKPNIIHRMIRR
jgi:pilus assembly protein CpaE